MNGPDTRLNKVTTVQYYSNGRISTAVLSTDRMLHVELIEQNNSAKLHVRIFNDQGAELDITDGDSSFSELRHHMARMWIALIREKVKAGETAWRTNIYADGAFFLGLHKLPGNQIVYKIPAQYWAETSFVPETLDPAPPHDGYTMEDLLQRLSNL